MDDQQSLPQRQPAGQPATSSAGRFQPSSQLESAGEPFDPDSDNARDIARLATGAEGSDSVATESPLADAGNRARLHTAGREDVELYIRTYSTLLRSSGPIRLKTLIPAHLAMDSSLHPGGSDPAPDLSAFIYSTLRLPACISDVQTVLLGQSAEVFTRSGYDDIGRWESVEAPARRRWWYFDGNSTLAVEIVSVSDVDDLVPVLVAFQIEWAKFHTLLAGEPVLVAALKASGPAVNSELASRLRRRLRLGLADWARLEQLWGDQLPERLIAMAEHEKQFVLRMLGGSHIGYARASRRWWRPVDSLLHRLELDQRPVYFVSSNTHSLVNLVSGFARRRRDQIETLVEATTDSALLPERFRLSASSRGSRENLLYYGARKLLQGAPAGEQVRRQRADEETQRGIHTITSRPGLKADVQVIDLSKLRPEDFDPRLQIPGLEKLAKSDAIVVNLDYPLGEAAYHVLRQLVQSIDSFRGIYVLGKAATLNGGVGDVMISDVIFDEHSGNTYWLDNCFSATDLSDLLMFGSVLDHQKAVAVKGTFLQNRQHLDFYYRENYTVVEMEAGPYMNALYEYIYPTRHPTGENISFSRLPVEVGLLHYASDTPYTRGKNLGARRISFFGMDSAYASSVAILRRIIRREMA